MLLLLWLVGDLDESRQADSIVKSWGVVEYNYAGWSVKNFDTLPVSDSIPVPEGEYKVIEGYKPLHVKGKWEYYRRDWKTYEFKPLLGTNRYEDTTTLLDWGKYLVIFIRGKGRYKLGGLVVYKSFCKGVYIGAVELDSSWREIRINLDSLPAKYNIYQIPDWMWSPLNHESVDCYYYRKGKFFPLSFSITPLVDSFGTYEFEVELSPIYLLR